MNIWGVKKKIINMHGGYIKTSEKLKQIKLIRKVNDSQLITRSVSKTKCLVSMSQVQEFSIHKEI